MRKQLSRTISTFALALGLALPSAALAETTAQSAAPLNDTDFKSVCGDVLKDKQGASAGSINQTETAQALAVADKSQKLEYCKAAEAARKGAKINKVLSATWIGVAGICATACATTWAAGTLQPLCTISNLSATGVDAITTANFTGALMSLMPQIMTGGLSASSLKFGSLEKRAFEVGNKAFKEAHVAAKQEGLKGEAAFNKADKIGTEAEQKEINSGRKSACISAATAGIAALTKSKSASSMSKTAKENIASAARVAQAGGTTVAMNQALINPGSGDGYATNDPTQLGSSGSGGTSGGGSYKSECESLESTSAAIECALASDPSLPSMVRSPEFQKQFEANSGFPFSDLLKNEGSAGGALAQAMGGGLPASDAGKLTAAIQAAELAVYGGDTGSAYAGGGGAAQPEGDPMLDAMQGMLANLQGQLGEGETPAGGTGVDAVTLANERRPASIIAEDRSLNLFDRVSYRYRKVSNGRL